VSPISRFDSSNKAGLSGNRPVSTAITSILLGSTSTSDNAVYFIKLHSASALIKIGRIFQFVVKMACVDIKHDKILEVERLGKSPETDQLARLQLNMT
jgi:hypothetical protein